ncbi:transcriptional regulator with XRE-family HTH domain [Rhodoblastus acidophilus]|uniref:helix-turn-helix domain-containing protein n=1 Tax=Rhodoblastus acidophilus TaxID=1074 RepID=UPI002224F6D5|nr:helix-turn-helix transcriptional regulator [Rhodoblastus acidophilus]MCW2285315.1 transcriptional regulator with XRE-family HTH domain [Rhodoblastus acidophilus]MCW2334271.1 transcriptional regulator with XRE-family HTH domain [Rhodoblastus acidophilus]
MTTTNIIDRAIGSRLRSERLARQFDAPSFAESVGVAPERLEAFETGIERIDARTMVTICKRLNVSIRHFFELSGLLGSNKSDYPLAAE